MKPSIELKTQIHTVLVCRGGGLKSHPKYFCPLTASSLSSQSTAQKPEGPKSSLKTTTLGHPFSKAREGTLGSISGWACEDMNLALNNTDRLERMYHKVKRAGATIRFGGFLE